MVQTNNFGDRAIRSLGLLSVNHKELSGWHHFHNAAMSVRQNNDCAHKPVDKNYWR